MKLCTSGHPSQYTLGKTLATPIRDWEKTAQFKDAQKAGTDISLERTSDDQTAWGKVLMVIALASNIKEMHMKMGVRCPILSPRWPRCLYDVSVRMWSRQTLHPACMRVQLSSSIFESSAYAYPLTQ